MFLPTTSNNCFAQVAPLKSEDRNDRNMVCEDSSFGPATLDGRSKQKRGGILRFPHQLVDIVGMSLMSH